MKIKNIGSNQTQVDLSNGDSILVSYSANVAANVGGKFYKTAQKWSVTTSKHISRWLNDANAEIQPQSFFDNLAA